MESCFDVKDNSDKNGILNYFFSTFAIIFWAFLLKFYKVSPKQQAFWANGLTDICDSRVAFATEKWDLLLLLQIVGHIHQMVGHVSFGLLAWQFTQGINSSLIFVLNMGLTGR